MNQLTLAYDVAKTQKGVLEIEGPKNNAKIVEYHQACTLQASDDETAWCSSFVNWCFIIAGIILNPNAMLKLLTKAKYDQADIDLFFKSAQEISNLMKYGPIEKEHLTGNAVKLPTRSAAARSWLGFGTLVNDPKEGDLVCFKRGNNGWSGHIAFFVKRGITYVECLGGNQGNQVKIAQYSRADVLGYIRLI
jgi:hypothetical protein